MLDPQTFTDELASVLRSHRKAAGLTQAALAKLAGVGKTAVFDLEHGKSTARLVTVLRLCHTLNIKLQLISPLVRSGGAP